MTRTVVQLRCHDEQRAAWYEAAGGQRKFSEWARSALDRAAKSQVENPYLPSGYPQKVNTAKAAGLCPRTGHSMSFCLCPTCKGV